MNKTYYFDHNATTRVAPEVLEAMWPFLSSNWGNPSSAYQFGRVAAKAIVHAREQLAALLQADPKQLIFTSGGTESINSAMHSALVSQPQKRHILTTTVEHSATLNYCKFLQTQGYEVSFLPVNPDGSLDLHLLEKSIRPDTAIVSVMWANNETGVMFPVPEIAALCRSKGVLFHTDAVQMAGKLRIDVQETDFLSLAAHKMYAPKGIGLLYVKRGVPYHPLIIGGGQEGGRRGGTENVAAIAGFGRAAELAASRLGDPMRKVRELRDRLENTILRVVASTIRNGAPEPRLPNTSNISFEPLEAEALLLKLDQAGICVSSGSACTTGSLAPSHVLTAMQISPTRARSSLRFSLGIDSTGEEVDYVLEKLPAIVHELRNASPITT